MLEKGCNWAPSCSDEVESNSCLEQMDKIMGNPSKCSIKLVPGLMEKTFALQRSYINTCPPVSSILNKYLALKLEEVVRQEMDVIINMKNVRKIFTNNLVKHASAIVNLASDRKKASSYITKQDAINDLEEQTPKAVAYERCVTAIMLIPEMLGEKSDGMIKVYDVSFKTI